MDLPELCKRCQIQRKTDAIYESEYSQGRSLKVLKEAWKYSDISQPYACSCRKPLVFPKCCSIEKRACILAWKYKSGGADYFFTLGSDGSKQISAPTAILSCSTAVLSNEHIWVLLPSRSVSGKWEMSPLCLGGSPGAAILFSGILKC